MAVRAHLRPQSRFWFKSPCWALQQVDFTVHVLLPGMFAAKYPHVARRLREASPRWGRR